MELGPIIWIIIAIVVFVVRTVMKVNKNANPPQQGEGEAGQGEPPRRVTSMEDILRRIEEAKRQQQAEMAPRPVANPWETPSTAQTSPTPRAKPLVTRHEEGHSLEEHPETLRETRLRLQAANFKAYDHVAPYAREKAALTSEGRFEHYAVKRKKRHPATKILDSPAGVRKAFILAEILNRKHF